jgi:hypothetical protein
MFIIDTCGNKQNYMEIYKRQSNVYRQNKKLNYPVFSLLSV